MEIWPLAFTANYFWDGSDLLPTADTVPQIMQALRSRSYMPSTVRDYNPDAGTVGPPRLRLATADNEWGVVFLGANLLVQKSPIAPDGRNMGTVADFLSEAKSTIETVATSVSKKSRRLSFVGRYLFIGPSPKELEETGDKLLINLPFFKDKGNFEWIWRKVANDHWLNGTTIERTNVVVKLQMSSGTMYLGSTTKDFTGVEAEIDINTKPDNTTLRYEPAHLSSFFSYASALDTRLMGEIKDSILGQ